MGGLGPKYVHPYGIPPSDCPSNSIQFGCGLAHQRSSGPLVEGRKRRELDPTISFLKECTAELASDRDTPTYVKDQIAGQLEFMETLMGWYESVRSLPRKTLLKMMRMGQLIGKVIGE